MIQNVTFDRNIALNTLLEAISLTEWRVCRVSSWSKHQSSSSRVSTASFWYASSATNNLRCQTFTSIHVCLRSTVRESYLWLDLLMFLHSPDRLVLQAAWGVVPDSLLLWRKKITCTRLHVTTVLNRSLFNPSIHWLSEGVSATDSLVASILNVG